MWAELQRSLIISVKFIVYIFFSSVFIFSKIIFYNYGTRMCSLIINRGKNIKEEYFLENSYDLYDAKVFPD